jgi:hypothetical protein
MISAARGLGCPLQELVPTATEINGGVRRAAKAVRFDFDPIAFAWKVDFLSMGRNRRPVRSAVLHGEFDFRALFLFAHFLFGQAKRKWATLLLLCLMSGVA